VRSTTIRSEAGEAEIRGDDRDTLALAVGIEQGRRDGERRLSVNGDR
jgi:hypothetical protein